MTDEQTRGRHRHPTAWDRPQPEQERPTAPVPAAQVPDKHMPLQGAAGAAGAALRAALVSNAYTLLAAEQAVVTAHLKAVPSGLLVEREDDTHAPLMTRQAVVDALAELDGL
jgi:hypothetical protein